MVEECFKCGISGNRALLFDAISGKGIVKICKKCSSDEDMPIVKRPEGFQSEPKERKTVYERLSRISGVDLKDKKSEEEKGRVRKQETNLRDLVDKNFEIQIKEKKPRADLTDNFHWIIMRVRRSKKITQAQLAEAIAEPEAAIKMAEQGILPDDYKLVNKLENYLRIKLMKKKVSEETESADSSDIKQVFVNEKEIVKQEQPQELSFDPITTKTLTISDLKEMKKKKEADIFGESDAEKDEDLDSDKDNEKPEFIDKDDLSPKDIDDILFGRKNGK